MVGPSRTGEPEHVGPAGRHLEGLCLARFSTVLSSLGCWVRSRRTDALCPRCFLQAELPPPASLKRKAFADVKTSKPQEGGVTPPAKNNMDRGSPRGKGRGPIPPRRAQYRQEAAEAKSFNAAISSGQRVVSVVSRINGIASKRGSEAIMRNASHPISPSPNGA